LTLCPNRVKGSREQDFMMRGLLMALFAFDFPGHDCDRAGRERASFRSTKTTAKATTKTV
jgi:hypothetical protein